VSYENQRTAIAALVNENWTTTPVVWPDANFKAPAYTRSRSAPAAFIEVRVESIGADRVTPVWTEFRGAMELRYYQEPIGSEQLLLQRVDALEAIINVGHIGSPIIYWDAPFLEPGGVEYGEEWTQATLRCPFRRYRDSTTTEILTLAGQGDTQITITETAHGFSRDDFVGESGGSWAKAIADGVGPLADGVVSAVIDADTFVLTVIGAVKLTGHAWGSAVVQLYLSQSTAGAATSTAPTTGLSQQVATVVDANRIFVNQYPAVNMG